MKHINIFKHKQDENGLTKREKKRLLKILCRIAGSKGFDIDGDAAVINFNLMKDTVYIMRYPWIKIDRLDLNNGSDLLINEDGFPEQHSGRYPWGSGGEFDGDPSPIEASIGTKEFVEQGRRALSKINNMVVDQIKKEEDDLL